MPCRDAMPRVSGYQPIRTYRREVSRLYNGLKREVSRQCPETLRGANLQWPETRSIASMPGDAKHRVFYNGLKREASRMPRRREASRLYNGLKREV